MESGSRWNDKIETMLNQFPILARSNVRLAETTLHHQPGVEFHMTHEGNAAFISNGQTLLQKPKQLLIHDGLIPHRFTAVAVPSYRRSVLCLLPNQSHHAELNSLYACLDFGSMLPHNRKQFQLDSLAYTRISEAFTAIEKELANNAKGWQQMTLSWLLQIVVILNRLEEMPEQDHQPSDASVLVQNCIEYVEECLADDLSLYRISKVFSISKEHLIRSFQRELGTSFHRYVMMKRIDRSKLLLQMSPELSMLDIALQTGFSSAAHFSKTFRQLAGETPTAFRNRVQQEEGIRI